MLLRKEKRSARFVRACELTALFIGTGGFAAMAIALPIVAQPESIVRGALTYVLLAYAAYVPSTARRTLLVASLMTVPLIACVFLSYRRYDPALHDPPAATWPKGPVGQMAYGVTVYSFVFWALAVAIAVGASRVIYDLRKAVRDIRRLGQYTLEEKLGEGGMGVVYRASHAMLRRPTAVKLLLPDRAGQEALARFEREVRRTAMLTHPNTVTIFDYGRTAEGVFYYAMELLEGATLHEIVETDGPQPEERVIHLLAQAAASLAEAHDAGLIHRDIKPGNILVVDRAGIPDMVKVVDFGFVKDVGTGDRGRAHGRGAAHGDEHDHRDSALPRAGGARSRRRRSMRGRISTLSARSATGCSPGTHVFDGRTVVEVCAHHMHTLPEPPSKRRGRAIAADLEALLLACLAKKPEDRPESAHVLRARLLACTSAGEWTSERAAAWWREHRDDLRSRRRAAMTTTVDPIGATLTITRAAQ